MRRYNKAMNALREKRRELGLTQIEAAHACGVSRRTYQTYEEIVNLNATYDDLLKKLTEMGILDGSNYIPSVRYIKQICKQILMEKYPEVESVFLFGSYSRNEATNKSDIDLVVVCPPMGMKFYGIASVLEEQLHKTIDLHSHRQLLNNEKLLQEVLNEGIKIYGR